MFAAVYESCSTMITSWEDLISKERSTELDVWPFIESLTGDVISRTAFGCSSNESRKIIQLIEEQGILSVYDPQPSNYIPGWSYLPTKKNRRVKEICREIEELLTKMIQSRKQQMETEGISKNDLLGTLLESNMREIKAHDNQKGKGLTTHEVVQECKIFYLAGSETTSTLLVWTLISLCKHQTWQDRARAEVLRVFGKDGQLNLESLNQLKIVNMIICEVLRFYSPVFMLIRKVHKDVQLGELFVPANTELLLPLCIAL
ncbi:cytochrome P450 CYP72A219-like [Silene latifolia]|uniref:cytochrome P450 CYP72A219-like n=1 Tax=Silene latifolia TaxID=37657 RepID=UPI003D787078